MIDLCLSFNKLTVFAGSYYAVCVFSQQYGAAKPFGERLFFGKWIVVGDDAVFYFNDILYQLLAVDDNPVGCYPSCHIKKICYVLLQRLLRLHLLHRWSDTSHLHCTIWRSMYRHGWLWRRLHISVH